MLENKIKSKKFKAYRAEDVCQVDCGKTSKVVISVIEVKKLLEECEINTLDYVIKSIHNYNSSRFRGNSFELIDKLIREFEYRKIRVISPIRLMSVKESKRQDKKYLTRSVPKKEDAPTVMKKS